MKNTKKMFLLFSHSLTKEQIADAEENLGVKEFIYLPEELQNRWSNIPPHFTSKEVYKFIEPVLEFIRDRFSYGDTVLVHGDFCATVWAVEYVELLGIRAYQSTTERKAKEIKKADGSIELISMFKHVRFREYN
jgi:hypothetical protein